VYDNSELTIPPFQDLDVDDESRTLVHSGPLVRQKSDAFHSWSDVFGALLDNYCAQPSHHPSLRSDLSQSCCSKRKRKQTCQSSDVLCGG